MIMNDIWYSYRSIHFSKKQLWWLVLNLAELKQGRWPERPEDYVRQPKMACGKAKEQGYDGYCITCPFVPCLNPEEKTPMKIRKEPAINKVLEIAAEVEARLELVMGYISGEVRPTRTIKKRRR